MSVSILGRDLKDFMYPRYIGAGKDMKNMLPGGNQTFKKTSIRWLPRLQLTNMRIVHRTD